MVVCSEASYKLLCVARSLCNKFNFITAMILPLLIEADSVKIRARSYSFIDIGITFNSVDITV